MKRCPTCNRTYADLSLNFCLDDGTPLATDAAPPPDLNETIRYPSPRDTSEPPPTEIYRPTTPAVTPRPTVAPPPPPPPSQPPPAQQWAPAPNVPKKRSNAIWWILGGFAAVLVIGIGLVVMIIALASLSSNTNNSNIANVNPRNANVNANANANANAANANANANVSRAGPLIDDFSQQKWSTGTSQYGRIWYADGAYHMSSKEETFVAISAPSNDYNTENATVKVTARSVDGSVPSAGFGLMVHCVQSRGGQMEDYALLIYPSTDPEYQIIMHKQGNQSVLVDRTKSSAIKSGSAPNQLEIRAKGAELSFYVNGQFLKTITDRENYRRGRVGFYTSDVFEVVFDDLQVDR